jgi:hypothetical protein
MAEKPPSTNNSTPFTNLESSEARNPSNVVLKTTVMPEWRKVFEAEILTSAAGPRFHGSVFFHSYGCSSASHLGMGEPRAQNPPKQTRSVPINALLVIEAPQAVKRKGAGRAPPALSLITSSKH